MRSHGNWQRNGSYTALLGGFVLIMVLSVVSVSAMIKVQASLASFLEEGEIYRDSLWKLQRHLGYGAFIHNYKNLVLRGDIPSYKPRIDSDIQVIESALADLRKQTSDVEDRKDLAVVTETLLKHEENYGIALGMIKEGRSATAIDAVVKLNDTGAVAALERLDNRQQQRASQARKSAELSSRQYFHFFLLLWGVCLALLVPLMMMVVKNARQRDQAVQDALRTRDELSNLLETAPDPMLSVDEQGIIVRANRMAELLLGYRIDELKGMSVNELVPVSTRGAHQGKMNQYFLNPRHRSMAQGAGLKALTREGKEVSVEINLSYSGDEGNRLVTITLRDISEREKNLKDLEELRASEHALKLDMMRAESMAQLGRMVAGVAHEINTPVGVMLGAASHLEDNVASCTAHYQAGELTDEGLMGFLSVAGDAARLLTFNSRRTAELVRSFKRVAVDQVGGERREFALLDYLQQIVISLQPELRKTNISITIECPADLVMDSYPGVLFQIISNLLMNVIAHAYGPKQSGQVLIQARLLRESQEDWVELIFSDGGCGVAEDIRGKVFDPFFTTNRKAGGSGLGLSVVYNLVRQTLRGSVVLESSPGQGARFHMRLPRLHTESQESSGDKEMAS